MSRFLVMSTLAAICMAVGMTAGAHAVTTNAGVPVPTKVAADCSRDVTGELNAWLASVADGSTLLLGAAACYRVDGTLRIVDRYNLTVEGQGAVVRAMATPAPTPKITRQMWLIRGGSNITVRNVTAWGTNPSPTFDVRREWFPLFEIAGTSNVLLDQVTGRNSWGDFAFITPDVRRVVNSDGTGAVLPLGVTIRNSTARVIGRHGVTCNGCDGVLVDHSSFSDIGYQVLDIEVEATTWHARDVTFSNNTIGGQIALSVLASGDNTGHDISRITLRGNTMLASSVSCAPPVQILETATTREHFVIADNSFRTLSNAFRIAGVNDVAVTGNTVAIGDAGCSNPHVAVIARNLRSSVMTNNVFPGARQLLAVSGIVEGLVCGNRFSVTGIALPKPCP
jgi:hypothetical protein